MYIVQTLPIARFTPVTVTGDLDTTNVAIDIKVTVPLRSIQFGAGCTDAVLKTPNNTSFCVPKIGTVLGKGA